MTLNLPPNIEAIAKEKAQIAGFEDVGMFVQRIIENASPEQASLPSPSDPQIIAAINAGFESGIEGKIDDAFWSQRLDFLESQVKSQQKPKH